MTPVMTDFRMRFTNDFVVDAGTHTCAHKKAFCPVAFLITLSIVLFLAMENTATSKEGKNSEDLEKKGRIMIRIVYDNNPFDERLETAWGFACVIKGLSRTILFDTGGRGDILLSNMAKCDIKPEQIDVVVLSHIHGDHTGGLNEFLKKNSNAEIFLPKAFPDSFKGELRRMGASVVETIEPCKICDGAWTTGVLDSGIKEQGLYIMTAKGLVVITGCAHPGVVRLAEAARRHSKKPLFAVLGGFHMRNFSKSSIIKVIKQLKESGVQQAGPCHCSGDDTRKLMKEAFGEGYLSAGVGAGIIFEIAPEVSR